jgi:rubrerythrin
LTECSGGWIGKLRKETSMTAQSAATDALTRFLKVERDGYYFYTKAAELVREPLGKEMFESLAGDEVEHAKKLTAQYRSLLGEGEWLPSDKLQAAMEEPGEDEIFPADDADIEQRIGEGTTDLAALNIAIEMEKASYEMYADAAREATDKNAKELYEHLAEEEQNHLALVENSSEYLGRTGFWFQSQEKPIFEGDA